MLKTNSPTGGHDCASLIWLAHPFLLAEAAEAAALARQKNGSEGYRRQQHN
jgi:hypothetical protein